MAAEQPIVDARLDVKVAQFSGRDEDWFMWAIRFEAYTSLLGWQAMMDAAKEYRSVLDESDFGETALK
eukprot:10284346-Lingulodinium_polyedra.AAC.1